MKTTELELDTIKSSVRERYGNIAENGGSCGCAPSCCGGTEGREISETLGYSKADLAAVPEGANLNLGCGNPLTIASLQPGQTVLDLGSGAGFDAFLAAQRVGPTGHVIGVDMTPAMITKARGNKAKSDAANVEFRLGEIENLPVANDSVDVILSNCVINLSPDKAQVFREAFRVLKPGGRVAISDIVALRPFPAELQNSWKHYTGCVTGAALVGEVEKALKQAGFVDIRVQPKSQSAQALKEMFPGEHLENYIASATIEAVKAN